MKRDYDLEWQKHLKSQEMVTSRSQALALGWPAEVIDRRLKSGSWQQLQRGAYAAFTGGVPRRARLWAAVLRAGNGAVLSHETAAEVHGFADGPSRKIHVAVPVERNPGRSRPIPGVVIHRARQLTPEWQPPWELPRTTVEDTVLDLINSAASFDDAYGWISRALGRRMPNTTMRFSSTAKLREALRRRSRIRWRTWLTEALADAGDGINSPLERRYVRDVERAHGLPAATRQAKRRAGSGNIYIDNHYEKYQLCVELDGAAAHPDEGRRKDTERDNANVELDNSRTLRYGWPDATELRCKSAAQIARVLCRQGWTGQPRPCSPQCPVGRRLSRVLFVEIQGVTTRNLENPATPVTHIRKCRVRIESGCGLSGAGREVGRRVRDRRRDGRSGGAGQEGGRRGCGVGSRGAGGWWVIGGGWGRRLGGCGCRRGRGR
jgi:hypothetical protein